MTYWFSLEWLIGAILVGLYAHSKQRSGVLAFTWAILLTPFFIFIVYLFMGVGAAATVKCQYCAEMIQRDALKCRYCNEKVSPITSREAGAGYLQGTSWLWIAVIVLWYAVTMYSATHVFFMSKTSTYTVYQPR